VNRNRGHFRRRTPFAESDDPIETIARSLGADAARSTRVKRSRAIACTSPPQS
jgi:hypothetical protein